MKIGHEKIFPQQIQMATLIWMLLLDRLQGNPHARTPLLMAQPQQGKTGAIICLIDKFIDYCVKHSKTFQVIVTCGLAELSLRDQTLARLTESVADDGMTLTGACLDIKARSTGLARYKPVAGTTMPGILVVNRSTKLRSLKKHLLCDVDLRLVISDECHVGNGKGGCMDKFLQTLGVRPNQQIHTWQDDACGGKTLFVPVSATPFAHFALSAKYKGAPASRTLYDTVYVAPGENYTSPLDLWDNRLLPTGALFCNVGDELVPSPILGDIFDHFEQECESYGPGYSLMRATGKEHEALMGYIENRNRRGIPTEVMCFDSKPGKDSDSRPISELLSQLATRPQVPVVLVIRGAFRAGMTLPQNHYIRLWVETSSDNVDTQLQAGVGRACGYGRKGDVFPIYCDIPKIQEALDFYRNLEFLEPVSAIPSGVQNHQALNTVDVAPVGWISKQEWIDGKGMLHPARDRMWFKPRHAQIATTRGNIAKDTALLTLRGTRESGNTWGHEVNGKADSERYREYVRLYPDRQPDSTLEAMHHHYDLLLKTFPGCEGNVIVFEHTGDESPDGDSIQRRRSALAEY